MSRRGHYPGGHSVWYSDTARAQNYKTGGGMNFGSGWAGGGSLPVGRYEGTEWVPFTPRQLPEPIASTKRFDPRTGAMVLVRQRRGKA